MLALVVCITCGCDFSRAPLYWIMRNARAAESAAAAADAGPEWTPAAAAELAEADMAYNRWLLDQLHFTYDCCRAHLVTTMNFSELRQKPNLL